MSALLSWNDGPARAAIIAFVERTVSNAVPLEERIAVFDADGTLWCEIPVPAQGDFILQWLAEMAAADPALGDRQPWRAAVERDHDWLLQVVREHYAGDDTKARMLLEGIGVAFGGIDVEEIVAHAGAFLRGAQNPALCRRYCDTAYAPMVELLGYLEANGFSNYIVSGSGGDFMRSIAGEVFGIPPERVIGSTSALEYASSGDGGTITHRAELGFLNDGPEKPIQVWTRVGRRPLLAAGNSNGDIQLLDFTQHRDLSSLRLLLLHDDPEREFAYTAGAEQALSKAAASGWTVVSMRDDFATVFDAVGSDAPTTRETEGTDA